MFSNSCPADHLSVIAKTWQNEARQRRVQIKKVGRIGWCGERTSLESALSRSSDV